MTLSSLQYKDPGRPIQREVHLCPFYGIAFHKDYFSSNLGIVLWQQEISRDWRADESYHDR